MLGINLTLNSTALASRTLTQKAVAVLRSFGSDAHVYMPGVGWMNGLTAGNWIDSAGTTPAVVDNPVGKVDDANGSIDATQATTANKPILRRGAVNLLTYSGDFSNAVWSKLRSTVSGSTITATETNGNGFGLTRPDIASVGLVTFAVVVEKGTNDNSVITLFDGTNGVRRWFDLTNIELGQATSFGAGVTAVQSSTLDLGSGKRLIVLTANIPSGVPQVSFCPSVSTPTGFGCTLGDIGIVHATATFKGTYTAQQIQALGGIPLTTTAPASTALGPYFWEFDGSNDSLALGSVPFQMADDHWVVGVFSNTSASGDRYIFDVGNSASVNAMVSSLALNNTAARCYWRDDSLVVTMLAGGNIPLGTTAVLSARKVGSAVSLRVNGVVVSTGTVATGATTLTGSSIGIRVAPGNLLAGSANLVQCGKGTITEAQLLTIEKYAASVAGLTI